jgi:hypothetical protein
MGVRGYSAFRTLPTIGHGRGRGKEEDARMGDVEREAKACMGRKQRAKLMKKIPEGNPESNPECLEAKLLHQVVMAVIGANRSDLLANLDDVNDYYGSRLPTVEEIVGGRPEGAIIEGGITWKDRVYRFSIIRNGAKVGSEREFDAA